MYRTRVYVPFQYQHLIKKTLTWEESWDDKATWQQHTAIICNVARDGKSYCVKEGALTHWIGSGDCRWSGIEYRNVQVGE